MAQPTASMEADHKQSCTCVQSWIHSCYPRGGWPESYSGSQSQYRNHVFVSNDGPTPGIHEEADLNHIQAANHNTEIMSSCPMMAPPLASVRRLTRIIFRQPIRIQQSCIYVQSWLHPWHSRGGWPESYSGSQSESSNHVRTIMAPPLTFMWRLTRIIFRQPITIQKSCLRVQWWPHPWNPKRGWPESYLRSQSQFSNHVPVSNHGSAPSIHEEADQKATPRWRHRS